MSRVRTPACLGNFSSSLDSRRAVAFQKAFSSPNAVVYEAVSSYMKVTFVSAVQAPNNLYVRADFYDVSSISGAHIHTNYNNNAGPIIVWLATSEEWQHGVLQNTPLTNTTASYACCRSCALKTCRSCCQRSSTRSSPNMCTLIAPPGTPDARRLSYQTVYYIAQKTTCGSCPWINDGTFLDVHGKQFQQVYDCTVVGTTPGVDMVDQVAFQAVVA